MWKMMSGFHFSCSLSVYWWRRRRHHCSLITNWMWSIHFELIIFPAANECVARERAPSSNQIENISVRICATAFDSIERKHTVPFSTYRYLFLWILWQCNWCVNLTNGNTNMRCKYSFTLAHTQTHTHSNYSHLSNFIYWCWGCATVHGAWNILFPPFGLSSTKFFLSLHSLFLIDWFLCVDLCIRENEADERLFFRNSIDCIWSHVKDISFSE